MTLFKQQIRVEKEKGCFRGHLTLRQHTRRAAMDYKCPCLKTFSCANGIVMYRKSDTLLMTKNRTLLPCYSLRRVGYLFLISFIVAADYTSRTRRPSSVSEMAARQSSLCRRMEQFPTLLNANPQLQSDPSEKSSIIISSFDTNRVGNLLNSSQTF